LAFVSDEPITSPFFENSPDVAQPIRESTSSGVREPREIRGRLRHCNGLRAPKATGRLGGWEGGSKAKPEVRIPVGRSSSWPRRWQFAFTSGRLLRSREGWGQPPERFSGGHVGCLHSPSCRGL